LGHVPGAIDRGADRERDAQPGPQRADQANREGHTAACERPDVSTDLRSDHGHSFQRRVQEMVLKGGIALEHKPEDRREYEQQREDGEEAPVRDLNAQPVGAIVEELPDHSERDRQRYMPLLPATQTT
jgi:hypothetical protein